jgi:hypothetical protein
MTLGGYLHVRQKLNDISDLTLFSKSTMDRNQYQNTPYPGDGTTYDAYPPPEGPFGTQSGAAIPQPAPVQPLSSGPYRAPLQEDVPFYQHSSNDPVADQFEATHPNDPVVQEGKRLSKKWQRRLYWSASRETPNPGRHEC